MPGGTVTLLALRWLRSGRSMNRWAWHAVALVGCARSRPGLRLHAHRGTARRAAAAEGDGRAKWLARRHRMGRVHRPSRSREHRRGPSARVGLRLGGSLRGRRDRPARRPALPDRPASVPGRGRSAARRADPRARHGPARRRPSCERAERLAGENAMSHEEQRAPRRVRAGVGGAGGGGRSGAARRGAESRVHARHVADRRPRRPRHRHRGQPRVERPRRGHAADDRRLARSDLRVRSTPTSRRSSATRRWRARPRRAARAGGPADPHGARERPRLPARRAR